MSKPAALLAALVWIVAAGAAVAGEADGGTAAVTARSDVLQFEIRGEVDTARAAGTWPVREYDARPAWHRPAAKRARKQYPNVMGVRFADWLAAHEAADDAQETPERVN